MGDPLILLYTLSMAVSLLQGCIHPSRCLEQKVNTPAVYCLCLVSEIVTRI